MGTPAILAAVTEALRRRLAAVLAAAAGDENLVGGGHVGETPLVTVLPPDRAVRENPYGLNVFLYHLAPMPRVNSVIPGLQPEPSPMGLRLRFLVSALGDDRDGTTVDEQRLLGLATYALHNRPHLEPDELAVGLGPGVPIDKHEWATIWPLNPSPDEMSALWQSFRAPYRLSVAYEVVYAHFDEPGVAPSKIPVDDDKQRLARRIVPTAGWKDLVLPPSQVAQLRNIASRFVRASEVYERWGFARRVRRPAIVALFAGPTGTGKRLAAEILASDLGTDLFRVDLSAVLSPYIGATAAALDRVLNAAEARGAVLLFDEADALFGKRAEPREAHDRYASVETTCLLDRIESYRGLVVLATNRRDALDPTLLRRAHVVVDFPPPGRAERRAMWAMAFPPETPLDDALDFDRLAGVRLTGASIHDVALDAAFLAAEADRPVSMDHVLRAVRTELTKLGESGARRRAGPPASRRRRH